MRQAVETIRSSKSGAGTRRIVIVTDENGYNASNPENGSWDSAEGCCHSPYVAAHDPRVSKHWPGGTYGGGPIPAIVVSPGGLHEYVDHTPYNHYSLLAKWRTAGTSDTSVTPVTEEVASCRCGSRSSATDTPVDRTNGAIRARIPSSDDAHAYPLGGG